MQEILRSEKKFMINMTDFIQKRHELRLRREDAQRLIACDYTPLLFQAAANR